MTDENTTIVNLAFDDFDKLNELALSLDDADKYDSEKTTIVDENDLTPGNQPIIDLDSVRGGTVSTNLGNMDLDSYEDLFALDKKKTNLFEMMHSAINNSIPKGDESLSSVNPFKEQSLLPKRENMSEEEKEAMSGRLALIDNMVAARQELEEDWKGASSGRKKRYSNEEREMMAEFFGDDWEEMTGTKKKETDPSKKYENKFKPRLKELDKLNDELTDYTNMVVGNVKELYKSRAKGSFKLIADSSSTVASLLSTKLSIIDKKIGITKTIEDLVLKSNKGAGGPRDDNFIIDQIMTKITGKPAGALDINAAVNLIDDNDYQSQVNAAIANISQLENDGVVQFSESERALQYQDMDPEIVVVADPLEKTWEFICLSDNGNGEEIPDYPLPSKELAKMEIDWEFGQYAKDKNSGITYSLILRG